jgi:dTDP-glucose pyrophosphorylase
MILLIPLGGTGERFKNYGYNEPKALIKIFGKPILYYLLDNLGDYPIDFIFIPYNNEYSKYRFEEQLIHDYPHIHFKFYKLLNNTEGAAQTINLALKTLTIQDTPILCLDGDNFYSIDIVQLWNLQNKVFTFIDNNDNPIYSYISHENNKIIDIVEKQKISNYACTGAYGFNSYKKLLEYTQKVIDNNIKYKNEYYTSVVIKEMIKDNIDFNISIINIENYHCLGTPIQLKYFYHNYPKISCLDGNMKIKNLRICFDLDNTLVTYPKIKNDYTTVEPIQKNIDFLKYLKNFNNIIIIYTSRNINLNTCNIGKITFDTLQKLNIPFDEIYFGKPNADIYIDHLGLNSSNDLEKSLGFYMENIIPREFNELKSSYIETFIKKSNDLSGEIYYYNNIPKEIKDLFPILIDYDIHNKWYIIEKINGLTLTNLYLSELLNSSTFIHIMNSIKRIQSVPCNINSIPIYENYSKKLKNRYETFNYSIFKNSNILYHDLMEQLNIYETENKGKLTVIHGDTVMTNILINNFGKIKFIDMRGKIGNHLTIYGDWLYDWSKLYQSLIGYDKILQNKQLNKNYEDHMIHIFETYFIEHFSFDDLKNLKLITKSLLFSLIPLHNNDKCNEYYDLIYKL